MNRGYVHPAAFVPMAHRQRTRWLSRFLEVVLTAVVLLLVIAVILYAALIWGPGR